MSDQIVTAPQIKVYLNSKLVGFASALDYSIAQGGKAIFTVDSPFPQELAQGAAPSFIQGTMTVYRIYEESPESQGLIAPRTVNSAGQETSNPFETSLGAAKYSTLELKDRTTENTILKAEYVMFNNQQWSIQPRGLVQGSLSFTGILGSHSIKAVV